MVTKRVTTIFPGTLNALLTHRIGIPQPAVKQNKRIRIDHQVSAFLRKSVKVPLGDGFFDGGSEDTSFMRGSIQPTAISMILE